MSKKNQLVPASHMKFTPEARGNILKTLEEWREQDGRLIESQVEMMLRDLVEDEERS